MRKTRKMAIKFEELSGKIIEAAIKVHKILGPGFVESVYHSALCIELENQGMKIERQKEVKIYYEGREVGLHRLDLIVEEQIVVELKTVKQWDDVHMAQLRSYLKATDLKIGLLLNFAKPTLQIKRVVS